MDALSRAARHRHGAHNIRRFLDPACRLRPRPGDFDREPRLAAQPRRRGCQILRITPVRCARDGCQPPGDRGTFYTVSRRRSRGAPARKSAMIALRRFLLRAARGRPQDATVRLNEDGHTYGTYRGSAALQGSRVRTCWPDLKEVEGAAQPANYLSRKSSRLSRPRRNPT